jgi:hypothetical protein
MFHVRRWILDRERLRLWFCASLDYVGLGIVGDVRVVSVRMDGFQLVGVALSVGVVDGGAHGIRVDGWCRVGGHLPGGWVLVLLPVG